MDITDGQHRNQIDYILCSQDGETLYSQQKQDQDVGHQELSVMVARMQNGTVTLKKQFGCI